VFVRVRPWQKLIITGIKNKINKMPPAAMGALFEKTAPLDPLQKLLIGCAVFLILVSLLSIF
jgi:hypothetical protein